MIYKEVIKMACHIEGTNIFLTRGDTLLLQLELKDIEGNAYTPQPGDVITFALKHNRLNAKRTDYYDQEPLITKTISNDTLILELAPTDTKELEFGEYAYEVSITFANGRVDTFIAQKPNAQGVYNNARFILTPEVN